MYYYYLLLAIYATYLYINYLYIYIFIFFKFGSIYCKWKNIPKNNFSYISTFNKSSIWKKKLLWMNLKYEIFFQWNTKFCLQKVLGFLSFRFCPKCMNSVNVVAEIQLKLLNEGALSNGKPCTCEYVTLHLSFHRGTLSIHWYIAPNF